MLPEPHMDSLDSADLHFCSPGMWSPFLWTPDSGVRKFRTLYLFVQLLLVLALTYSVHV